MWSLDCQMEMAQNCSNGRLYVKVRQILQFTLLVFLNYIAINALYSCRYAYCL